MELSSDGDCDLKLIAALLLFPMIAEFNAAFFKSVPNGAVAVVDDGNEQPTESTESAIVFRFDGRPRISSMPFCANRIKTTKCDEALR